MNFLEKVEQRRQLEIATPVPHEVLTLEGGCIKATLDMNGLGLLMERAAGTKWVQLDLAAAIELYGFLHKHLGEA